jgi:large subunit ribosomal protein L2
MPLRRLKPITPARRGMTVSDFSDVTIKTPEKSLLTKKRRASGRNADGHITIRHRGGGAKRHLRIVDFQGRDGEAKVAGIAYDPARSARLALLEHDDGSKSYVIATTQSKTGRTVVKGEKADVRAGNRLKLRDIPVGTAIHNIELNLGQGGKLVRSAGVSAVLMAKETEFAQVRLPSGEVRLIHQDCEATIGVIGNADHSNLKVGKAGRKRHMGIRPSVRGKAMNPVDHPHGGGEGGTDIGMHPKTPWGAKALGLKTRRRKYSNNMIIRKRRKKRR